MNFFAKLADYKLELNFNEIEKNDLLYPSYIYSSFRILSAFFSSLTIPISYLIFRFYSISLFGSVIGTLLINFEPFLISQSRLISSEGIIQFFFILTLLFFKIYLNFKTILNFLILSIITGLFFSTSYQSIWIILIILIKILKIKIKNFKKPSNYLIIKSILFLLIIFLIYYLLILIKIINLPFLPKNTNNIPIKILNSLINKENPEWDLITSSTSIFLKTFYSIFKFNKIENLTNNLYNWYEIPLFLHKLEILINYQNRNLIFHGNIILLIPLFFLMIYLIIFDKPSIFLLGYFLSFYPYSIFNLKIYLNYYQFSIFFMYFELINFLSKLNYKKFKGFIYMFLIFCSLFGYFLWNPWIYGLITIDYNFLIWFKSWKK